MSLKQLLGEHRSDISSSFVREVARKDLAPRGLSRSVLLDHIPTFLDEMAAELSKADEGRASLVAEEVTETARQHGEQRWKYGYDLEAVVREYDVLRKSIAEVAKASGLPLTADEANLVATYLNTGVAGATAEYVRFNEEQSKARQADLEFLGEASELLGSSLDYKSTLARLTGLLVPRLADLCVVQLDDCPLAETPIAHVDPAKVGLIREILRRFPLPPAVRDQLQRVSTGTSLLVEAPAEGFLERVAQSPEHLALLNQLGARSWLVVPLRIKNHAFGTVTLAWSDSPRRYQPSDVFLAEDLARRAAAAIDNARLYDVARTERARAEAATRAKDEFVAMVSHELRTPLNVIIGWVRLLRVGSLPEKTREEALEVVERNANAQSRLVADLLDISRALTGKVRLDPAQVDLGSLVTLVLEDARFAFEAKRIRLHVDFTHEDTTLRGDGERLKQIVWNLVLNAIKFTQKGGEVHVQLTRVESDLELTVQDTGVGIAPEFLPHIFDIFRQSDSKTTRSHGGLGIGLSIAKHLVDLHGGSIEGRSEGVGKGASFRVRLPISPLISTTVGVVRMPATMPPPPLDLVRSDALAGLSVLVVDDEQDARDLLRIVLEACGVIVHDAGSVKEALDKLEQERVDLLVSDIGMPNEDGYSLARTLRTLSDPQKASIPAIALTAFASTEDRSRALLEGFNVHMTKPVAPADLLLTLTELSRHIVRKAEP